MRYWLFTLSFLFTCANADEHLTYYDNIKGMHAFAPPLEGSGCELLGKVHPLNTKIAMNRQMLKTFLYVNDSLPADQDIIFMECRYLVSPTDADHPAPEQREYVWVSH